MKDFLFPQPAESKGFSLLLLCLRLLLGILLIVHGLDKLYNYTELCYTFPDPTGIGREISLLFAIFAEMFCAMAFIFGALTRLSLIPILLVMAVAFFHVHQASIVHGELSFLYLVLLVMLYITGPGKYSVDAKIYEYLHAKDYEAYEY